MIKVIKVSFLNATTDCIYGSIQAEYIVTKVQVYALTPESMKANKYIGDDCMRMYDVIEKKKVGGILTETEIQYMVDGFTDGSIPDYQVSALLMAIYYKGMNKEETLALTMAMARSGDMLDLSEIDGIKVDKHSTGGVGDKTSLVLAPMVAALGVPVAKMSGRGLGHTGGTIDKLEAFKGFTTKLDEETFIKNVNTIKIAIAGQTANLAPADKKLYALRDVTATVDNISLIAGSIMSKKIASGSNAIVLDVKTGSGAFMREEEDAMKLARTMVDIGNGYGRETVAIVTDMNQPLGYAVGNTLEVIEAIETLKGNGPKDLLEVCLELGTQMIMLAKLTEDEQVAREMLQETITSGSALNKFKEFIEAQGGEVACIDDVEQFEKATIIEEIVAKESGYICHIETEEIGFATMLLGGGRETKESVIDLAVGYVFCKKLGDFVKKGDSIATVYANDRIRLMDSKKRFLAAISQQEKPYKKPKLIKCMIK